MIRVISALAVAGLMTVIAPAQGQTPPATASSAASALAADTVLRTFMFNLQAGKAEEAVDGLLRSSTTPAQKPDERANLLAQIQAAVTTYGPILSYEKGRFDNLGTMVTRQYYFVQHREMVVRWEFTLVRAGSGWKIDYFGFDDQPRSWF
jgi:hypothetical protein